MLDTNHAQIYVFGLNTVERETDVVNPKSRRSTVGAWSQARYQRRADNLHLQHVKDVVETLDRIVAEENLSRIVVIGGDVAVPILREQRRGASATSSSTSSAWIGRRGEDAILQATLEALREKDAETDAEHVGRMLDAWRAGGLAVAGPEATLEALQLGQVDELLVASTPQVIAPKTPRTVPMTSEPLAVDTSDPAAADARRLIVADELRDPRRADRRPRPVHRGRRSARAGRRRRRPPPLPPLTPRNPQMTKHNNVNPGQYRVGGRLTPDEAARERVKQRNVASPSDALPAAKASIPARAPGLREKNAAQAPQRVEAKPRTGAAGRSRG